MPLTSNPDPFRFLGHDGEVAGLIRGLDWVATPIGSVENWSPALRSATALIMQSALPIVMLWGREGVMIYNDAYSQFSGHRHPALLGSNVREGWKEIADFNDNVMNVGLAGGTLAYRDQELTLHRHGYPEQVWMDLDYSPIMDEDGKPAGVIAIVVETTERVKAQAHQKRLINELNHRVKNTLASIQSIVGQTLRGDQPKAEAAVSIFARILALSRAHNLLTDENWDGADLETMVNSALEPFQANDRKVFYISGPTLRIGPHAALSIALALQELASNAAKFGALSVSSGMISVSWKIGADDSFTFVWSEQNAPSTTDTGRRGFGSRLLERVLPKELQGTTRIEYRPSGIAFTLATSLTALTDAPSMDGM